LATKKCLFSILRGKLMLPAGYWYKTLLIVHYNHSQM